MKKDEFIVEKSNAKGLLGPAGRAFFYEVVGLQDYLCRNPHPEYRLASCQFEDDGYVMVWQLKE